MSIDRYSGLFVSTVFLSHVCEYVYRLMFFDVFSISKIKLPTLCKSYQISNIVNQFKYDVEYVYYLLDQNYIM